MKKIAVTLSIVLVSTLFLSFLFGIGLFSNVQFKLSDNLYGGYTPLSNIVIIAIDDKSLQDIGRWPWDRTVFAQMIDLLGDAKVVGIDVAFFEPTGDDSTLAEAMARAGNVVIPVEYTGFYRENGEIIGRDLLTPTGPLSESAAGYGYVNIITDGDGVTRAVNFDIKGSHQNFASEVYTRFWGLRQNEQPDRFLINYVGRPGSFTTYSFTDVLSSDFDKFVFKDNLVFIGATAPDLHDDYFVPTSQGKAMPGVEIHANTIQTLITNRQLHNQKSWSVVLSIFLASLLIGLLMYYFSAPVTAVTGVIIVIAYLLVSIKLFEFGIIMNLVFVPFTMLFSFIGLLAYYLRDEKKHRIQVLGAFEKYVSKSVISHILEDPTKLKLGGERREITVFFSDIRGFTTISEKLDAHELVELLNEYLTEMTNIVLKYDGVVDKYMGDAIMAFWGAPFEQKDHHERASQASLEMIERLLELQKDWTKRGVPPLDIGIGLNTGDAVVGNMGSYDRFDYTAMGDTINLGARLESINKQYGTRIIISEFTNEKIHRQFSTRLLDIVKVKGKTKPVAIYELVGLKTKVSKVDTSIITHYEDGMDHYKKQEWDEAIASFNKVLKVRKDVASDLMISRCGVYKKKSPGKNWDGSFTMKTK